MAQIETRMQAERYQTPFGEALEYRLYTPDKLAAGRRYPLVLFLHGAGERGEDNRSQLVYGVADILDYLEETDTPAFLLAPQCPSRMQWVNTDMRASLQHALPEFPSYPLRLVIGLLETFIHTHPVDLSRVYLTGLSMGGFGSWDLLMRRPHLFAAAIPICGGGDETKAASIEHIPQWIFHGSADPIIRPERSRRMVAALQAAGGDPKYSEYEGVEHNAWSRTYADPEVLEWLFEQRKR